MYEFAGDPGAPVASILLRETAILHYDHNIIYMFLFLSLALYNCPGLIQKATKGEGKRWEERKTTYRIYFDYYNLQQLHYYIVE